MIEAQMILHSKLESEGWGLGVATEPSENVLRLVELVVESLFSGKGIFPGQNSKNFAFDFERFRYVPLKDRKETGGSIRGGGGLREKKLLLILAKIMLQSPEKRFKKRELFYKLADHVGDQTETDTLLNRVCLGLKIRRNELNIFPNFKGLVFGAMKVGGENLGDYEAFPSGRAIDFPEDKPMAVFAEFALIVEKETVFSDILARNFAQKFPTGLLITGRGYADFPTREFVRRIFRTKSDLPFFYLGDLDPYGLEIYINLLISSPLSALENHELPFLTPLGLGYRDLLPVHGPGRPIEIEGLSKLNSLLTMEIFHPKKIDDPLCQFTKNMHLKLRIIERELRTMKEVGRVYEIEDISKSTPIDQFIGQKLKQFT